MSEEDTKPGIAERVVELLEQKFDMAFFSSDDVKAASAVGALMSYTIYLQEKHLETKGLTKVVSRTFDHMSKKRLLMMFNAACSVMFKLQNKEGVYVSIKHRILAGDLLSEAVWESKPDELQVAFVMGYDAFNKVRGESSD